MWCRECGSELRRGLRRCPAGCVGAIVAFGPVHEAIKVEAPRVRVSQTLGDRVVGVPEIAALLGVAPTTPRSWIARGQLPQADMVVNGRSAWWAWRIIRWAQQTGRIVSSD
jgi:predicted DNA-binding transcriptional regulator AlpA